MALKNRVRTATYSYDGNSIKLKASFENLNKLREMTGKDPIGYLTGGLDNTDADALFETLRIIFFCLQADTVEYSQADIHDALFGDIKAFADPENLTAVGSAIAGVLGADLQAEIAKLADADDGSKKK